jgi:hypothetical protein
MISIRRTRVMTAKKRFLSYSLARHHVTMHIALALYHHLTCPLAPARCAYVSLRLLARSPACTPTRIPACCTSQIARPVARALDLLTRSRAFGCSTVHSTRLCAQSHVSSARLRVRSLASLPEPYMSCTLTRCGYPDDSGPVTVTTDPVTVTADPVAVTADPATVSVPGTTVTACPAAPYALTGNRVVNGGFEASAISLWRTCNPVL